MTKPTAFELACSSAVAAFRTALQLADAEPNPQGAREQLVLQIERACDKELAQRLARIAVKTVPR